MFRLKKGGITYRYQGFFSGFGRVGGKKSLKRSKALYETKNMMTFIIELWHVEITNGRRERENR